MKERSLKLQIAYLATASEKYAISIKQQRAVGDDHHKCVNTPQNSVFFKLCATSSIWLVKLELSAAIRSKSCCI